MDRVLKRVGLSKKSQTELKSHEHQPHHNEQSIISNLQIDNEKKIKIRRRRRSKSRRRSQDNKKTRGLFNIDWESVKDCKSCKSKAITRRFCSKRCDNELYRSNSFKFERFIRGSEDSSTFGRKIAVCDDYSLPADNVGNRRRPNSIAVPTFTEWPVSSPNEEKVEILETYSTPRDSQQKLIQEETESKCFTSPDREYSQPYTTEGSSEPTSDEEFFGHQITITLPVVQLNSPDSIGEAIIPQIPAQSPNKCEIKRHPSPYYYADLFKNKSEETKPSCATTQSAKVQKVSNLLETTQDVLKSNLNNNQKSKTHHYHRKYKKSASLDSTNLERTPTNRVRSHARLRSNKKSSSVDTQSTDSRDAAHEAAMPPNRVSSPCACLQSNDGLEDDMSRQRHVYETAFDCRINKSDDDLDEIDKVTNHSVLIQISNTRDNRPGPSADHTNLPHNRRKVTLICPKPSQKDNNSVSCLSQKLQNMRLQIEESTPGSNLPLRGYTPSPPSTAPLPTKFHGKELVMNSIRSAPNLPTHPKARLKDLHLPVKSLRSRSPTHGSSGSLQLQRSAFDIEFGNSKGRPGLGELAKRAKAGQKETLALGRRRRHKYSSTESMTTSSSGGSMESIKSSTSEGNRSTTSSDSRQSSSLSSHSSDSGNGKQNYANAQNATFLTHHANKLHILSPISDKSSQEPVSETSDNNKNNNSQTCSPEEGATPDTIKVKRRLPQNKNLLNLSFQRAGDLEIQGSDSGISVQSREGINKSVGFASSVALQTQPDFDDLPFDMPKLRRRRIVTQDACTSGSTTSVDLRELPFDMPKLKRRMRVQPNLEASVSQASSSQSVIEANRQVLSFRTKLTLNLGDLDIRNQRPELSLLGLSTSLSKTEKPLNGDVIDVNLPLEKQGWFHGAITRVEAENVLRVLREGSFLVRNSESTKQDYSLSLKSARGFMHMRIQRNGADECYILGQFSKPFHSIPEMIQHFCINRLPIRGAEHMCLLQPVVVQLL